MAAIGPELLTVPHRVRDSGFLFQAETDRENHPLPVPPLRDIGCFQVVVFLIAVGVQLEVEGCILATAGGQKTIFG